MKRRHLLFLILLTSSPFVSAQTNANSESWVEDLDFLSEQIHKAVPSSDKASLSMEISSLKKSFQELSETQKILGIQKLLAGYNDEGIKVLPIQQAIINSLLPIKAYWFKEDIYILDSSPEYSSLINQRLISFNGIEINELYQQLAPFLSADNENYKKHIFPFYMLCSAWLKGAGIISDDVNEVQLTLGNGEMVDVSFGSYEKYAKLKRNLIGESPSDKNYLKEYDALSKTLTIQFRAISDNDNGDNFSKFVKTIEENLKSNKVDRVIIDNRFGGGGNGFKLKPFTDMIRENPSINQKGRLFVLTSRATRGTVMELTSILELNSKAIIIGEPTGEGPNKVGDYKVVELPNSKIRVTLTHTYWPTSWKSDIRTELIPNKEVSYSFDNYLNKEDPWTKAVNSYSKNDVLTKMPKSLLKELPGKYQIEDHKVAIENMNGRLFLTMNRKIKSFFEIHTELYFKSDGELVTDIDKVLLRYSTSESKPKELFWKGTVLNFQ